MEHRNLNWSERTETLQVDKLLASRYSRLVQWATVLTRGDKSKADDVVQEFCLYISLVSQT
jgi:DNA-directed RNA polymerase specialized sigma24 family protein